MLRRDERGLSTVELIVSIFIFGLILTMLFAGVLSFRANRQVARRSEAGLFAEAELEALRDYPFDDLADRTDGNFIGFAFNHGMQAVAASSGARSSPNVVEASPSAQTLSDGTTSLMLLKDGFYDDANFSAAIRVSADSGSGWSTGLVFRYDDVENYYAAVMSSTALRLIKVDGGAQSVLATYNRSFSADQWYKLGVIASGANFQVLLNDSTIITKTDATLARGSFGVFGAGEARYSVDDVAMAGVGSWNFDHEAAGGYPEGFLYNAPTKLADLTALLTVSGYNGSSTIKQIDVEVSWSEYGATKSVTLSTLKTQPYETP